MITLSYKFESYILDEIQNIRDSINKYYYIHRYI